MKKVILILIIFFVVGNLYSQSGWIAINTPANSLHYFVNANIGWYSFRQNTNYKDTLLKTTNGGYNWFYVANFYRLEKFYFLNENTGFIIARRNTIPQTSSNLLKTTNGGTTWDTISVLYNFYNIQQILFINSNTGMIYASQGESGMRRTTDSGFNWISISNGGNTINFPSLLTGYSCNGYSIMKTINSGQNWSVIKTFASSIYSISFANNTTGWILQSDTLKKTGDGGYTWTVNSNTPSNKVAIFFINENKGWLCGSNGMVFNTSNGGQNWNVQNSNTLSNLFNIKFLNENTGFISGYGVLLRTTTGGTIGIKNISSIIPKNFLLKQNYPNPFNPETKIQFDVAKFGDVKISVFDISGKELNVLVNERMQPGTYEVEWNGEKYASGIYFYRMQAGDYVETRKMILMK